MESNQAGAHLGHSVATAGDVNNDGVSDVIVGVTDYDNGETNEGRTYVYYGSAAGLATTPDWTAEANRANSSFGNAVATAGDVNGDGYADVVIGASFYDNGQLDEGRAYVYHGSATGLATSPAWTIESNESGARYGESVATTGDVNGDGYADVVIGAPFSDPDLETPDAGVAFVYRGSATGLQVIPMATLALAPETDAHFGISVATAGDVNGDGFADIIVGAPGVFGLQDRGEAFVFLGNPSSLNLEWTELGPVQSNLAAAVATAGDVNGDGYSDVLIGAQGFDNGETNEGGAFVYHGEAEILDTVIDWTAFPGQNDDHFGVVASAGDVNGDGYSDVIIGSDRYDNGQMDEGRAYVYHGSASGLSSVPVWTAESNQVLALLGFSVARAGDVNGDGYSDVIVGAPNYTNGNTNEGRAYVYYGSDSGLSTTPAWTAESNQDLAYFGGWVATAGDVNGDGYSDVIVGAWSYSNGQTDEGRAYVYLGSASGLASSPAWTAESNQDGAFFGRRVGSAGDVNGDGYSDVIVGAELWDNPLNGEGKAYVYHGSATGLALTPAWTAEGNQAVALFGCSVGTAGDVNGDRFSDVIVGARQAANPEFEEGRAYVYHGSAGGLALTPNWTAEPNFASAFFGESGTAGDVNGDGFSDVIVGADQAAGGRAYVYRGSVSGLGTSAIWIGQSGEVNGFGWRVATAGDVNGDGFSEVIVGAQAGLDGKAYLFYGNYGDGLHRIPRQARVDNTAPIDVLGLSDAPSGFRLKTLGRTPAGRGRVRLEWEVKRYDVLLDGANVRDGVFVETGAPGPNGSVVALGVHPGNLASATLHHWRLRVGSDSPFFPRSPWLSLPYNGVNEGDFRTRETTSVADDETAPARHLLLEAAVPNPFASATAFAYTLPYAGRHRIAVYDVLGREVALLAEEAGREGRHIVRWDGRDARGRALPAGTYFVRLDLDGHHEAQKVTLTR